MYAGCLVEFPVENSHEEQYQDADDQKDRESNIADYPGVVAYHHVDIDHEKSEPTGDEKDETYNHHEEKHGISPCNILGVVAKLYKLSGRLSMVFSFRTKPYRMKNPFLSFCCIAVKIFVIINSTDVQR